MMHSCYSIATLELYASSLQSNEVGGSYYMELEGRSYLQHETVGEKSVNWYIGTLIRDRHGSGQPCLQPNMCMMCGI